MNILCVGDVTGNPGMDFLEKTLPRVKNDYNVDFVIVNGENVHESGTGITRHSAEALFQYADVITTGNHCYRRCDESLYNDNPALLHPANFPYTDSENGCFITDTGRNGLLRVINLAGVAWMEPLDNPFTCLDRLLEKSEAKYTIIDFHAESTAEKKALAYYADGRVSAVFGTHTHVQTADEEILPKGTGFISDVGMTGPINSIIGMDIEPAVQLQKYHRPVRFATASGPCRFNGIIFSLNDQSGLCEALQRINIKEN